MAERPAEKRLNRPLMMKFREGKRSNAHRSFSRQVSLETSVSKLNKAHNEVKVLPRSGRSFSGFGSSHGVDQANVKKGEFNMFRMKSTLSVPGLVDTLAALTGPDFNQVQEDILLPKDKKWPFLLRFPIGCFAIADPGGGNYLSDLHPCPIHVYTQPPWGGVGCCYSLLGKLFMANLMDPQGLATSLHFSCTFLSSFSVAWWSYTFPMTTIAVASIKYAEHDMSVVSKGIALTLSFLSSTMVFLLFISTFLHAFVWQTLFPNDLAIAITKTKHIKEKKPMNLKRWARQSLVSIRKNNSADKHTLENE
ncbi:guard cell S-type anion channel SLAC1 [Tanacetum coccineum]